MSTLWDDVNLTSSGSTPTTITTTYTTFPVALPFPNPTGPTQPGAPVTGTVVLLTQQILTQGQTAYNQLLQNSVVKNLFDSVTKIPDGVGIENRVFELIRGLPQFQSPDYRLAAINNADSALLKFDTTKSFSDFSVDDRKRIHALLALRRQLYLGMDDAGKAAYWLQQRSKPVAQWPLNAFIYTIGRSPTQNNLDYARRIVDWQYDDAASLQQFVNLLQGFASSQTDAGRAANILLPILQFRLRQLGLQTSKDGKCGPTNGNTRCPTNQCCMTSGQCATCDKSGSRGLMMRPDLLYNGEGVLPVLPPTLFGGAGI